MCYSPPKLNTLHMQKCRIILSEGCESTDKRKTIVSKRDIFSVGLQPLVGQGLLIFETSRSHSDTPHSLRLIWRSDQLDTEAST